MINGFLNGQLRFRHTHESWKSRKLLHSSWQKIAEKCFNVNCACSFLDVTSSCTRLALLLSRIKFKMQQLSQIKKKLKTIKINWVSYLNGSSISLSLIISSRLRLRDAMKSALAFLISQVFAHENSLILSWLLNVRLYFLCGIELLWADSFSDSTAYAKSSDVIVTLKQYNILL